jgi:hypothetical protein
VDAFGLPTAWRGSADTAVSDTIRVSDSLPFRFSGLVLVSGELASGGWSCGGNGWVRVMGDPVSTLPSSVALGLLLVGLILLAVAVRSGWAAGAVGGLLLGTAGAILTVIYAVLPMAQWTPLAAIGAGLLAGLAAGGYGSRHVRRGWRRGPQTG